MKLVFTLVAALLAGNQVFASGRPDDLNDGFYVDKATGKIWGNQAGGKACIASRKACKFERHLLSKEVAPEAVSEIMTFIANFVAMCTDLKNLSPLGTSDIVSGFFQKIEALKYLHLAQVILLGMDCFQNRQYFAAHLRTMINVNLGSAVPDTWPKSKRFLNDVIAHCNALVAQG